MCYDDCVWGSTRFEQTAAAQKLRKQQAKAEAAHQTAAHLSCASSVLNTACVHMDIIDIPITIPLPIHC
jgi:hypothetical protein